MNLKKYVTSKRQAVRLHIESMKVTQASLKQRAKDHKHDTLSYKTAHAAVLNLEDKIIAAKQELNMLEKRWRC
jgi:hypothetical protein